MPDRPFPWMVPHHSQEISQDGQREYVIDLELADAGAIGLRKEWITIHQTLAAPLPHGQTEAALAVLTRARAALDKQIEAIQQSS